jgi:hypothetical protein
MDASGNAMVEYSTKEVPRKRSSDEIRKLKWRNEWPDG